jgi:hypothetical protein
MLIISFKHKYQVNNVSQASVNNENVVAVWVVPAGGEDVITRDLDSIDWECRVYENVYRYLLMGEDGMAFWNASGWTPWFMLSTDLMKLLPFSAVYAHPSGTQINVYPSVLLVAHLYKPYDAFMLVKYLDWEHAYESPEGKVYPDLRTAFILGNLAEPLYSEMFEEAFKYLGTVKPLKVLAKCFEKYKKSVGNIEPIDVDLE